MEKKPVLTVLQWFFGLYFIVTGILHFIVPDGLPAPMSWMYELNDTLHLVSGTAEIAGGLGLILPGLTKIRTELTWIAAACLSLLMVGAAIWHIPRGETQSIVSDLFFAGVLAYLAMSRRKHPIATRPVAA